MAEIGGGTGIVEGIGNILGMLGERSDQQHQDQLKQRELMADHLESQAKEIGDNIMRAGGFDAPEAQPLVESLGKVTERYRNLFPPHETPALINRLKKFVGIKPSEPKADPRAELSTQEVMARARRPEFEKTPKGQRQQADLNREIAGTNAIEAQKIQQKTNEAALEHAKQSGMPQEQLDQLRAILEGLPPSLMRPPAEKSGQWERVDGKLNGETYSYYHSKATNENTDMNGNPLAEDALKGFVATAKTAGSSPKPKQAWTKDASGKFVSVMLDANNQKIPGTENYDVLPPASLVGRVTQGVYHWPDEDGNLHETPVTTTSRPNFPAGGAPSTATPPAAVAPPSPAGRGSQTAPTAQPAAGAPPAAPGAPKPPTPAAGPRGGASIPATPAQARDRILGQKGTAAQTDARKILDAAVGMSSKADLAWSKPSATNDKALVMALIKDTSGRFNMAEYDALVKGTGFANSMEGLLNKLTTGELPKGLRKQLVDAAHNNLTSAREAFNASRQPAASAGGADVDAEILRLLNAK